MHRRARRLGENSLFITPRREGGIRDLLIVECSQINGNEFKGTITYTEAMVKLFYLNGVHYYLRNSNNLELQGMSPSRIRHSVIAGLVSKFTIVKLR